ncbi:hypothetical protein Tco_0061643, partial [Tanacetum coccineum]
QKRKGQAIALKAKKESSDDETSTSRSDDEEYTMAVRNFKKFFTRRGKFVRQPREEKKSFWQSDDKKGKRDRKCFRCGDSNHLIGEFQSLYETRIKRHLLEVVGAIVKMKSRTKPKMKLVSWLYRQMWSLLTLLIIAIMLLLLMMMVCKLNMTTYVKLA